VYIYIYYYECIDVSGFSPPHGLFSPELGHATDHIKEHLTSYAAEGQPETGSDAIHQVQQPAAALGQSEPATVDDTRNEVKKIVWRSAADEYITYYIWSWVHDDHDFLFFYKYIILWFWSPRSQFNLFYTLLFIYYCPLNPIYTMEQIPNNKSLIIIYLYEVFLWYHPFNCVATVQKLFVRSTISHYKTPK